VPDRDVSGDPGAAGTPFASLETYIGLGRVGALALAPDGKSVVLTVATLSRDRTRFVNSLWSVPTRGDGAPRRLTTRVSGAAAFTPGGDVLFVSDRAGEDPDSGDDAPEHAQLWCLPRAGGDARAVTALPGGVSSIAAVAAEAERIVLAAELLHSADSLTDDARRRATRKRRKVAAILHETYPVRFWDHDLGPDEPHLLALELTGDSECPLDDDAAARAASRITAGAGDAPHPAEPEPYPEHLPAPRDLTPHPGRTADIEGAVLTPDGGTLIASIQVARERAGCAALAAYDTRTAEHRMLFAEPGTHFESPQLSHDGATLAFLRTVDGTPDGPTARELWIAGADGSDARRIAAGWDRFVNEMAFSADDTALIVTADDGGRAPVFAIALDDAAPVRRLTDDDFAYTDVAVDRHTGAIFALRSSITAAPHPVRIDLDPAGVPVTALATPAPPPPAPGRVEDVQATATDGTPVRGWLVLPDDAGADTPAPLLLWIHGGPVDSSNSWSWRWNPLLATARGYAVLLPDPGLSTGYGLDFVARGWNAWGEAPYTDLMAITDAVARRADIDAGRTAALGGSFGGYMANWVAGHTDRFDAIVSHASLWALDAFGGTTDRSDFWDLEFTPAGITNNSPNRFVADIRTPMLVIHGDRDYRVPIGESLRLWSDLAAHHARPDGTMDHRFLYFPDENHWILAPQHAIVWWETVFAFLAAQVRGAAWERPPSL
jgi:dipeptidyl aminopeptidase/acylaminoacyl peptidase